MKNLVSGDETRGLVTFAATTCSTGMHLLAFRKPKAKAAACGFPVDLHLVISCQSCDNRAHVTEYCTVIGPALYRAAQQTAVKEVTRLLPSLAERGVATRD